MPNWTYLRLLWSLALAILTPTHLIHIENGPCDFYCHHGRCNWLTRWVVLVRSGNHDLSNVQELSM